jgi:hypothetical protein
MEIQMNKLFVALLISASFPALAAQEMTVCPPATQESQADVPGLRSISTQVDYVALCKEKNYRCHDAHMAVMGNKCFKITALHGQIPVAQEEKPNYHEPANSRLQLVPR